MGFDIPNHKATIHRQADARWSGTKIGSIALAVRNALLIPEKSANKRYFINSFTATHPELLAAYEKVTGQKWEVEWVDAEEQLKLGREAFEKGDIYRGAALTLRYLFTTKGLGADYAEYRSVDNEELGLPNENLEEAVRELLEV